MRRCFCAMDDSKHDEPGAQGAKFQKIWDAGGKEMTLRRFFGRFTATGG